MTFKELQIILIEARTTQLSPTAIMTTYKKGSWDNPAIEAYVGVPDQQGVVESSAETSWSNGTDKITLQDNPTIKALVSQDQAERNEYLQFVKSKAGGDWTKGAKMYVQLKKRPSDDIFGDRVRLNQFMKMTFDFNKFTDTDWDNYWLLAQHSDENRDFQKNALLVIKKHQGVKHPHYKYLYDRISLGLGGKQKYGTQNE